MPIARHPSFVLDCADPGLLAGFYGALLDLPVEIEPDWAEVRGKTGYLIGCQLVTDYRPPQWPGQEVPQQAHLDFVVDDLDAGQAAVVALGATVAQVQPGTEFRVFLDPAGHPFCLVLAEPLQG